jgi:hypothetical protein
MNADEGRLPKSPKFHPSKPKSGLPGAGLPKVPKLKTKTAGPRFFERIPLMRYWRDKECRDASTRAYPDKPDSRHAQHDRDLSGLIQRAPRKGDEVQDRNQLQ